MRVEISPFVASSLLDHAKRKAPARGFLLGQIQLDVISVQNFIPMTGFPDFFEQPKPADPTATKASEQEYERLALLRKKQQKTAVEVFRQAKAEMKGALSTFYPHDASIIGAYAIGDGEPVKVVDRQASSDTEVTVDVPFEQWARAPLGEMLGDHQCILVSVTTPSQRTKAKGCKLTWKAELCAASAVKQVDVSIVAESDQTSVVIQTVLDQAANACTSTVNLDEQLYQEPSGSTATKAVGNLMETVKKTAVYANAVVAGKEKGDKALAADFLAKQEELKKARSVALDGSTPHDPLHDALLVKYTVSLLRSQVVAFQTASAGGVVAAQ